MYKLLLRHYENMLRLQKAGGMRKELTPETCVQMYINHYYTDINPLQSILISSEIKYIYNEIQSIPFWEIQIWFGADWIWILNTTTYIQPKNLLWFYVSNKDTKLIANHHQKTERDIMPSRNYKKEYKEYHSKPEQRKNRSKRNMARRKMMKKGLVKKGDGKEVDHIKPLSKGGSNGRKNLRVVSRKTNRKKGSK